MLSQSNAIPTIYFFIGEAPATDVSTFSANVCPGTREYPFSFALPQTLPDTFKNPNGHIEYYIKAKVDIPWAPDFESRRDVTVRTPLDLNKMPNICLVR